MGGGLQANDKEGSKEESAPVLQLYTLTEGMGNVINMLQQLP